MHKPILTMVLAATPLVAQTFPLPASAGDTTATENSAPFVIPTRMSQSLLTNRNSLAGLPSTFNNWDMVAFDRTSQYVYVPCENFAAGAGVFRFDTRSGNYSTLVAGNGTGVRTPNPNGWDPTNDDFVAIDPCSLTPWDTIILGEEATGGRFFEVTNPLSSGPYNIVWHTKIPGLAHEGMRFDSAGNLYLVDESNTGSIYKFVPLNAGDLSVGQTLVLSVDAYASDPNAKPAENWNSTANRGTTRFGLATWVPMTDRFGNPLTVANPFVYVTATGGRDAADELRGTPYGRPEDMDLGRLANGNEVVYCAITSENRVLSIELLSATTAVVREFVNFDTINLATGMDVNPLQNDPYTSPGAGTVFNNPDNIAIDAFGSVYVIEDASPGDIWKTVDANADGVAEALGIFVTLGVSGAEPSGMIFDPNDPFRFICCVQHPASSNDALWSFRTRPYAGSDLDLVLSSGVKTAASTGPGEFVKTAGSGDPITFRVTSPNRTFDLAPFALLLQPFATASGQPPFMPPVWVSPFQALIVVAGGTVGGFPVLLPAGGHTTSLRTPAGLNGLSVMAQGLALSPLGMLVATDGHEVIFQ